MASCDKIYICAVCGSPCRKEFRCVKPNKYKCPACGPLWGDDKVVAE